MKLRRREAVWLLALGGLLLAVRGMDSRTASLRRSARESAAAAAAGAAPVVAPAPSPAAAGPAGPGDRDPGAPLSTADLATLAWGPNPFRGSSGRRVDAVVTADRPADGGLVSAATPAAPQVPRFRGLVTVKGRTLAALDGEFLAPGERSGEWIVQEIGAGGVIVRRARTGEVRRLGRERTATAP